MSYWPIVIFPFSLFMIFMMFSTMYRLIKLTGNNQYLTTHIIGIFLLVPIFWFTYAGFVFYGAVATIYVIVNYIKIYRIEREKRILFEKYKNRELD